MQIYDMNMKVYCLTAVWQQLGYKRADRYSVTKTDNTGDGSRCRPSRCMEEKHETNTGAVALLVATTGVGTG